MRGVPKNLRSTKLEPKESGVTIAPTIENLANFVTIFLNGVERFTYL